MQACAPSAPHSLSDPVSHSSLDRSLKASSPTVFSLTHRHPSSLFRSRLHRSSGGVWGSVNSSAMCARGQAHGKKRGATANCASTAVHMVGYCSIAQSTQPANPRCSPACPARHAQPLPSHCPATGSPSPSTMSVCAISTWPPSIHSVLRSTHIIGAARARGWIMSCKAGGAGTVPVWAGVQAV